MKLATIRTPEGTRAVRVDGGVQRAKVHLGPFFDPEGAKLRG